ncbi:hypothetical protein V1389_02010 [Flavobacterium rakeshii]|uniref:hypothetical protein n=1 Tax=Flavobacterium rakeshii TaxID=1038845 RepID=UPI002E7ADF95|nr:hypothetical protein [Flavobacterium rakeshii]MEE1897091.1 hypothetical protein [Flavobacterium rakeshii]
MEKLTVKDAVAFIPNAQNGNGVSVTTMSNGGKYKVRKKIFYIAGLAAELGSEGQLIEQKTNKEVGITNFDGGNKLNKGRNLLVIGVRMLFDTTASVAVKTATWLSATPANFKNGELVISQDGTGNLFENPIGPFSKYNASIATEDEFQTVVPFLIREDVTFKIQALLAGAAAADQAYRLELECIEFVEADK